MDKQKVLEILQDAFSVLDEYLGDSDLPVESDEEEREAAPVQYAARRISEVIQGLTPDVESNVCPTCDGSGEVAGNYFAEDGMETCPDCGGKGHGVVSDEF